MKILLWVVVNFAIMFGFIYAEQNEILWLSVLILTMATFLGVLGLFVMLIRGKTHMYFGFVKSITDSNQLWDGLGKYGQQIDAAYDICMTIVFIHFGYPVIGVLYACYFIAFQFVGFDAKKMGLTK